MLSVSAVKKRKHRESSNLVQRLSIPIVTRDTMLRLEVKCQDRQAWWSWGTKCTITDERRIKVETVFKRSTTYGELKRSKVKVTMSTYIPGECMRVLETWWVDCDDAVECEYRRISRNRTSHQRVTYLRYQTRISATAEIARVGGHDAVQGHSRSLMLVPVESPYATYILSRIVFPVIGQIRRALNVLWNRRWGMCSPIM